MVRKPQILLRASEFALHGLLAVFTYLAVCAYFAIPPQIGSVLIAGLSYPLIRAIFDEYSFIRFASTIPKTILRELFYASIVSFLAFLPIYGNINAFKLFPFILTVLIGLTLIIQPILSKQIYSRFPTFRIHALFLGPAPLAEHLVSQINTRGLSHLFHVMGYTDYKATDSSIPFIGKLSDIEQILDTKKPQVMINTGRHEQHATLVYAAMTRGIQYFSLPQNVQWQTFELNHPGPFHLPLIEHTSSRLTYWSHATKRIFDITLASTGLLLFGIPFLIRKQISKDSEEVRKIDFIDPRNKRERQLTHVGPIAPKPDWRDIPLFIHVLKNQLSLVGPRPHHALSEHHFDLKSGIFPFAHPEQDTAQNEIHAIQYIRHWNVIQELRIALSGFAQLMRSLVK